MEHNIGTSYRLTQPITTEQLENDVVVSVAMGTVSFGAQVNSIEEDTVVLNATSVAAVFDIADYLDDQVAVDDYTVDVYNKEPMTGNSETVTDIDLDALQSNDFDYHTATFVFTVFFKPEFVLYDGYMTDEDDSDDDTESLNEEVSKTKKSPLWISIDGMKAGNGKEVHGEYIVQPHPRKTDVVILYIKYLLDENSAVDFVTANKAQIEKDLEVMNTGAIGKRLTDKEFKLTKTVKYSDVLAYAKTVKSNKIIETPHSEFKHENGTSVKFLMEALGDDITLSAEISTLLEIKRVIKVNFKGKKRIKMQCMKGYRYDSQRKVCVKITGSELAVSRRSKIKAIRTKKSLGMGFKVRTVRKSKKANRFRKMLGLG